MSSKCSEDSLSAERMNVRPGGKQPVMRDTIYNSRIQKMVLPDGQPKGMKIVLQERGVDTSGMNAEKMRKILEEFEDFKNKTTLIEEKVQARDHLCMSFPKFHYELNASERCWCHSKKHTRAYANGSITQLRKIVPEGLDSCNPDLIKKFFRTCRDYCKAYRGGYTCRNVDAAVKVNKSHRHIFNTEQ